jgi:hypothetical protein
MAVCCDGAATGADLSPELLVSTSARTPDFFFDELRRRGFIEGQNLTVEYRAYAQHVDLIPQYAAELVKARVDVIVTAGEEAVRAVQQATKTIPIVGLVGDMLGSGFVNSLSRPDGNTTGVSILAGEVDGKRQDILIEAVPGLKLAFNATKRKKRGPRLLRKWGLKSRKSRQRGPSKKANHRSTTGPQVTAIEGINIDRGRLKSQEECHDAQSIFPVDPGCARTTESLGARH